MVSIFPSDEIIYPFVMERSVKWMLNSSRLDHDFIRRDSYIAFIFHHLEFLHNAECVIPHDSFPTWSTTEKNEIYADHESIISYIQNIISKWNGVRRILYKFNSDCLRF